MKLFEKIGQSLAKGASQTGSSEGLDFIRQAPAAFIDGILNMIEAPPARLLSHFGTIKTAYNSMTPEDQERAKQVARTLVDVGIKVGKSYVAGKSEF